MATRTSHACRARHSYRETEFADSESDVAVYSPLARCGLRPPRPARLLGMTKAKSPYPRAGPLYKQIDHLRQQVPDDSGLT